MSQSLGDPDVPAPVARPRLDSRRWGILAVLLAFSFMSWFNRVSMSVAYDERIQAKLGISEEDIGSVYSALLFAYALCMTPGGFFADRWGARLALTLMGVGSALFVVLTGYVGLAALPAAATVLALLVVRALLGVFTAPIYPASGLAIAQWFPSRQRAGANGAIMAAALVGIASCYHAFGALLDRFDWPVAFMITGVVTAQLALLWAWFARDLPGQHPHVNPGEPRSRDSDAGDGGGWRALLTNRSLLLLTLSYGAVGYFEYLFYFWMHYYFEGVLRLPKEDSRTYATILNLAMAAGMLLGGWLADLLALVWGRRWGRCAVIVGGMIGGAVFLGRGLFAEEAREIVFWFGGAMAAVGATEGPFWATALELGGRHRATAAGIFNTGGNAGGVLAPALTPRISKAFGWPWGIGLGGLVCLAGVCLWLWINPEEHEERGTTS
jgi:sugar phosphate permease